MRIVFVAPFGLTQKTTVWARTLPLARQLVQHGHTVAILIPPWDSPADSGKEWIDDGVELIHVSLRGGLPAVIVRLLGEIDKRRPEIIHIVKPRAHAGIIQWLLWQRRWLRHLLPGRFFSLPGRLPPTPQIFLDIDDWEQAWAAINHYPWLIAKFLAWQEEWGIRHADGISAASRWLETRAHAYRPSTPILYLPNGIEWEVRNAEYGVRNSRGNTLRIPHPSRTSSALRILYLSRYVEVEPLWLAEFWQSLQARLPEAHLLIAGTPLQPGRDTQFQQTLIQQAPLAASHVTWLGSVNREQIDELYTNVDCAIFPAAPTVLQQAKCSVRLMTTLLHGVPVVASAVGEQANYGADGAARLVPADATPAQFAEAVIEVLRDPSAQATMIACAHQRLQSYYQWSKLAADLAGFYNSVAIQR